MKDKNLKIRNTLCFTIFLFVAGLFLASCEEVDGLVNPNKNPVIDRIYALRETLNPSDTTTIVVEAHDDDEDALSYQWSVDAGVLSTDSGSHVVWTAPSEGGNFKVSVKVTDAAKGRDTGSITMTVLAMEVPAINILNPANRSHFPGLGNLEIEAEASHPNGIREVLFYVDNVLLGRDNSAPYRLPWQIEGKSGSFSIRTEALRAGPDPGVPGIDSVLVKIEGVTRID